MYLNKEICDACGEKTKTRNHKGLDPKRPTRVNFLCKRCDNSYETIPKLLKWNSKFLPETHSIFGFPLDKLADISSIEMKVYMPK